MSETYAFCESVTASAISPWCIRKLTSNGLKFGGGVDTSSLCGRVREGSGWDIDVPVKLPHSKACHPCSEILKFINEIDRLRSALRDIIDQEDMAEARVIASTALHDPYNEVSDE